MGIHMVLIIIIIKNFSYLFTLTVFLFVEPSSWSSVQPENKPKWPGVPAYIARP